MGKQIAWLENRYRSDFISAFEGDTIAAARLERGMESEYDMEVLYLFRGLLFFDSLRANRGLELAMNSTNSEDLRRSYRAARKRFEPQRAPEHDSTGAKNKRSMMRDSTKERLRLQLNSIVKSAPAAKNELGRLIVENLGVLGRALRSGDSTLYFQSRGLAQRYFTDIPEDSLEKLKFATDCIGILVYRAPGDTSVEWENLPGIMNTILPFIVHPEYGKGRDTLVVTKQDSLFFRRALPIEHYVAQARTIQRIVNQSDARSVLKIEFIANGSFARVIVAQFTVVQIWKLDPQFPAYREFGLYGYEGGRTTFHLCKVGAAWKIIGGIMWSGE